MTIYDDKDLAGNAKRIKTEMRRGDVRCLCGAKIVCWRQGYQVAICDNGNSSLQVPYQCAANHEFTYSMAI